MRTIRQKLRDSFSGSAQNQKIRLLAVAVLASIILVFIFEWLFRHDAPNDFLVYRYAGEYVLNGQSLYPAPISGPELAAGLPFTYPPFAGLVFTVLTIFPLWLTFYLWSFLSILCLVYSVHKFMPAKLSRRLLVLVIWLFLLSATTIAAQNMFWGQINVLLLALCLVDLLRSPDSRFGKIVPPGLLIGIAAAIKLTPALFLLYFLVSKQWRRLFGAALGFLAATALAALLLPRESWKFWVELLPNLDNRVSLSGPAATSDNNSLVGFFAAAGNYLPLLLVLFAIFALVFAAWLYRRAEIHAAILVIGISAALLSPASWIHHWVFLLPALVFGFYRSEKYGKVLCLGLLAVLIAHRSNLGEVLLGAPPVLAQLGFFVRKSLIISSAAVFWLLAWQALRRPAKPGSYSALADTPPTNSPPGTPEAPEASNSKR